MLFYPNIFNDVGPFHAAYLQIIPLSKELTENFNVRNITQLQNKIRVIKEQLEFEKRSS